MIFGDFWPILPYLEFLSVILLKIDLISVKFTTQKLQKNKWFVLLHETKFYISKRESVMIFSFLFLEFLSVILLKIDLISVKFTTQKLQKNEWFILLHETKFYILERESVMIFHSYF